MVFKQRSLQGVVKALRHTLHSFFKCWTSATAIVMYLRLPGALRLSPYLFLLILLIPFDAVPMDLPGRGVHPGGGTPAGAGLRRTRAAAP